MSIPPKSRCSWPSIITVVTRDQYGEVVHVPNMRVEVKAVPVDEMNIAASSSGSSRGRKSAMAAPDALTFGGHRAPNLEPKYEATVKDKMVWHAITVQKCFDNYRVVQKNSCVFELSRPLSAH